MKRPSRLASGSERWPRHRRCLAVAAVAAVLMSSLGLFGVPAEAQTAPAGAVGGDATQRLVEAVFNNDLERVKTAIADGARYDQEALLGRSALDVAIDLGHFEIAHYLLALRQQSRARLAKVQPVRRIAPPPPFVPAPPPPNPADGPQPPAPPPQQAAATPAPTPPAPAPTAPAAAPASPPAQPLTPVTVKSLPGEARKPLVAEARPTAPAPETSPAAPTAPPSREAPGATAAPTAAAAPASEAAAPAAVSAPATVAALPPAATAAQETAPSTAASESTVSAGLIGIGQSLRLGLSSADPIAAQAKCVDRRSGTIRVCLLPVDWPDQVAKHFAVESFVYSGAMTVARFEDGTATRYYVQFQSSSMDAVTAYYRARLGPPAEARDYQVDLGGKGTATSRLVRWRAHDAQRGRDVVLEVRRYDDVRRQSVDPDFGIVEVYDATSAGTFSGLTALDIMRLR